MAGTKARSRCGWGLGTPLMTSYHDREWGVPVRDDRLLFEHLVLDGAQAGLSWRTILEKREGYRKAFAGFDPARMARFDRARVERLLVNPSIVRNRLKIESAIENARAYLRLREQEGSFGDFLWSFVGDRPLQNRWRTMKQIPAETDASRAMSRELKRRGFRFVGPTICYAFMQASGMVNDHVVDCFRHGEVSQLMPVTRK